MAESYTQEQLDLAIRLTDELDVNSAPQQTKKGVTQPYSSGYYMLYYALKEQIGQQKSFGRPLVNDLWRDIGDARKRKWGIAFKNSNDEFKKEGKARVNIADKKSTRTERIGFCRYCALCSGASNFLTDHLRDVHYPQIDNNQELDNMLKEDLKNAKKKSYIDFWECLHADEQNLSDEEREEVEKYTLMYEDLFQGEATNTLYSAIQLPNNFDDIDDKDLPKEITRYTGQYSELLRHLKATVGDSTDGNIALEIRKLVTERIQLYNESGTDIPNGKRLYFWNALKVPADLIDVFERATIMANWQLCGRGTFWNQQISAIPQGKKFRTAKPDDIVFLGLVIIRKLMLSLRQNVMNGMPNDSVELIQTYDNFTPEQKARFDKKYKIGSEEQPVFPTHLVSNFVDELQQLAEDQANDALLQLITQFRQSLQVAPPNEEE